jgi:hypothetical protein
MIHIKFRYFWQDFDVNDNFILTLLRPVLHENKASQDIVLEFHSVFTKPRRFYGVHIRGQLLVRKFWYKVSRKQAIFIWYSGENIKPPLLYDLTLSFKPPSEVNIYWPFWATRVIEKSRDAPQDTQSENYFSKYVHFRERNNLDQRNWKMCTFLSNPTAWRLDFARKLENIGLLDIYGSAVNRYVDSKPDIAKQYVFELCFENELSEGYVTEKIIEAWENGCVPIYCGLDTRGYLNPEAFLDLSGLELSEAISKIMDYFKDTNKVNETSIQPILARTFNSDLLIESISRLIDTKYP